MPRGLAYRWFMTTGYPRVKEIIQQDLGSALIYLSSHAADFKNPDIRPYLDKYVRGSNGYDAVNRVKVMKLLWDAIGSEFGSRHELYERNYGGNHEAIRTEILAAQDATGLTESYRQLADRCLAEYDLDGWTVSDLVNPDDVNMIGELNLRPSTADKATDLSERKRMTTERTRAVLENLERGAIGQSRAACLISSMPRPIAFASRSRSRIFGTHGIFIGRVEEVRFGDDAAPPVYEDRYH